MRRGAWNEMLRRLVVRESERIKRMLDTSTHGLVHSIRLSPQLCCQFEAELKHGA